MAVVYPWCNEKAAHSSDARRGLEAQVAPLLATAQAVHAAHRDEGHSFIDSQREHINFYIVLNDWAGDKAAAAIEYGRLGGPGIRALQAIMGG